MHSTTASSSTVAAATATAAASALPRRHLASTWPKTHSQTHSQTRRAARSRPRPPLAHPAERCPLSSAGLLLSDSASGAILFASPAAERVLAGIPAYGSLSSSRVNHPTVASRDWDAGPDDPPQAAATAAAAATARASPVQLFHAAADVDIAERHPFPDAHHHAHDRSLSPASCCPAAPSVVGRFIQDFFQTPDMHGTFDDLDLLHPLVLAPSPSRSAAGSVSQLQDSAAGQQQHVCAGRCSPLGRIRIAELFMLGLPNAATKWIYVCLHRNHACDNRPLQDVWFIEEYSGLLEAHTTLLSPLHNPQPLYDTDLHQLSLESRSSSMATAAGTESAFSGSASVLHPRVYTSSPLLPTHPALSPSPPPHLARAMHHHHHHHQLHHQHPLSQSPTHCLASNDASTLPQHLPTILDQEPPDAGQQQPASPKLSGKTTPRPSTPLQQTLFPSEPQQHDLHHSNHSHSSHSALPHLYHYTHRDSQESNASTTSRTPSIASHRSAPLLSTSLSSLVPLHAPSPVRPVIPPPPQIELAPNAPQHMYTPTPVHKSHVSLRLSHFGRILQVYPLARFLHVPSQAILSLFIMGLVHTDDLATLTHGLSLAVKHGRARFVVRWDWSSLLDPDRLASVAHSARVAAASPVATSVSDAGSPDATVSVGQGSLTGYGSRTGSMSDRDDLSGHGHGDEDDDDDDDDDSGLDEEAGVSGPPQPTWVLFDVCTSPAPVLDSADSDEPTLVCLVREISALDPASSPTHNGLINSLLSTSSSLLDTVQQMSTAPVATSAWIASSVRRRIKSWTGIDPMPFWDTADGPAAPHSASPSAGGGGVPLRPGTPPLALVLGHNRSTMSPSPSPSRLASARASAVYSSRPPSASTSVSTSASASASARADTVPSSPPPVVRTPLHMTPPLECRKSASSGGLLMVRTGGAVMRRPASVSTLSLLSSPAERSQSHG